MDTIQYNDIILKKLFSLEKALSHLAVHDSLINFHIIINTLIYHYQNSHLLQKGLFLNLSKYSVMGLRYQMDNLVEDGWIYLVRCENDKRMKVVKPTNKLLMSLSALLNELPCTPLE